MVLFRMAHEALLRLENVPRTVRFAFFTFAHVEGKKLQFFPSL